MGRMKTRDDYKRALAAVTSVVHCWDPYGLLAGGAPSDEFDPEIAQVVTRIPHIHTAQDAANALSLVFSEAFEPDLFTPELCLQPGSQLYTLLKEMGLV
jgi:hypothetical protein